MRTWTLVMAALAGEDSYDCEAVARLLIGKTAEVAAKYSVRKMVFC